MWPRWIVFLNLDPSLSPKFRGSASDSDCVEQPPAKKMKSISSTDVATDDEDNEVLEKPPKDDLRNITVELEGKELWERFSELGTEMIITKAGRWNSSLLILECCWHSKGKNRCI